MYNITNLDQQYIMQQYDTVEHIIENTVSCMNSSHPFSNVHFCFAEATRLLHYNGNISKFKYIKEKFNVTRSELTNFYRSSCIDIPLVQPKLFSSITNILLMMENFENDLDIEISYRSKNYIYNESSSEEHPVFTYKNTMEVLDGIYNYK